MQYMAPEVLARQHYSQKADVYSFGIVLFECCSRQVGFYALDSTDLAQMWPGTLGHCSGMVHACRHTGRCPDDGRCNLCKRLRVTNALH